MYASSHSRCFALGLFLLTLPVCAGSTRLRDQHTLASTPIYTCNERELDAILHTLSNQIPDLRQRLVRIARQSIGQPYRLFVLGEFPYELYDADPMYCLHASDCVTFVEQSYAMALGRDWTTFFASLQRLRYKDSRVGLLTRNHFTEADWNVNNRWLFNDITEPLAPGGCREYTLNIDRAAFFKKFGMTFQMPVQKWDDRYISRDNLPSALDKLHEADIIEFVRGPADAPYVAHLALVSGALDGPSIIHASKPAVREENLRDYVNRHTDILGIKVLRPRIEFINRSTTNPDAITIHHSGLRHPFNE